jgi:hypothetical protein
VPPAEQIGRYRILDRIGAGGMGTVYKAHDPHLDRTVALKVPHIDPAHPDRAKRVERFQREARSAAQVWHPHVCPIYDVGEHDGQPYVVMAYVEGRSLAERLARGGRFEDVGEAVALTRQVLDALGAVHGHGIVHRDLKPSNIMLDAAGRAVLTDFGLARPGHQQAGLTSEGVIVGTPAYMAPEQAAGQSDRIGPWTDLYSVGVVLFEMLTGRLPFEGPPLAVLGKLLHEPPPALSSLRPYLDPRLESALLRATAKEPEGRFQSVGPFADALRDLAVPGPLATASQAAGPGEGARHQGQLLPAGLVGRLPGRRVALAYLLPGGLFALAGVMLLKIVGDSQGAAVRAMVWLAVLGSLPVLYGRVRRRVWRRRLSRRNSKGETCLMTAARDGNLAAVTDFLSRGAEVNDKDRGGQTALMRAAGSGHVAVVRLLLAHGAEVNEKDSDGLTALIRAEARGHQEIVGLLKKSGARDSRTAPNAGPHPGP